MASSSTNVARTPPLLHILSDFDGTIIHEDTLIDLVGHSPRFRSNGGKKAAQKAAREIMLQVARQSLTYRGAFDMICGIIEGVEGEEGVEVMVRASKVDETFPSFVKTMSSQSVPLTILSSGFRDVISQVMLRTLGPELSKDIQIVASNHVVSSAEEGLKWSVSHVDDSTVGHDKSRHLTRLKEKHGDSCPVLVFCGDGLNDILPSRHADLVFAKKGSTLTRQCGRLEVPFKEFEAFAEIEELLGQGIERIHYGERTVDKISGVDRMKVVESWRDHVYGSGWQDRAVQLAESYKAKDKKKAKM